MINSKHKLASLPKSFTEAAEIIATYLNQTEWGYELFIHEIHGESLWLVAWNPHKNQAERKPWLSLDKLNASISGLKLAVSPDFRAGVVLSVEAKAPIVEAPKQK